MSQNMVGNVVNRLNGMNGLLLFATSIGLLEICRYVFGEIYEDDLASASSKEKGKHLSPVTVSSPGKVLIAGGYLILEKENLGITIAGTSRFFATVLASNNTVSQKASQTALCIVVRSPQFHDSYTYGYSYETNQVFSLDDDNVFVAKCLQLVFTFLYEYLGESFRAYITDIQTKGRLEIILQADNDFYSQNEQLTNRNWEVSADSLRRLPKFIPCPKGDDGKISVAKTGLGSSATLTTSLVAALLRFFNVIQLPEVKSAEELRMVHNLAQLVHCKAQGKVGSGFDVASAVYGTQVYQRFSPAPFETLLDENTHGDSASFAKLLVSSVLDTRRDLWDQVVLPFRLPFGLTLLLGDVCGGSNSPAMARAVLDWRKRSPSEAQLLWTQLASANRRLLSALQQLHRWEEEDPNAFGQVLYSLSSNVISEALLSVETLTEDVSAKWMRSVSQAIVDVRSSIVEARQHLREMGQQAGVDIEPASQTKLCDATMSLPGVIAAGVPGAGGQDAIFAIVLTGELQGNTVSGKTDSPIKAVEKLWAGWQECNVKVCPLLLRAWSDNVDGPDGLRMEK